MSKPKIQVPTVPAHKSKTAQVFTQAATAPQNTTVYPWETDAVANDTGKKAFNVRLSRKNHEMLKFIGRQPEHTSAHAFIEKLILSEIEKEAARLKKLNRI